MGFWNDGFRDRSSSRSRSRSRSHSRDHSKPRTSQPGHLSRRSTSNSVSHTQHAVHKDRDGNHYASRPTYSRSASSLFSNLPGLGGASSRPRSRGAGSVYSRSNSYSGSRARGSRPRNGLVEKIKKWLRELYGYMRRHPVKVFVLVIMPLITGGALSKILSRFGVRLPRALQSMVGSSMNRGYGGRERFYARGGARDFDTGSALPGMMGGGGGGGWVDNVQGLVGVAKMFM